MLLLVEKAQVASGPTNVSQKGGLVFFINLFD